jgi:hypothetical protein
MQNTYINFQEERNFSDKINATFQFLTQNAKPLFRLLLFSVGPFALLTGILLGLYQIDMRNNTEAIQESIRAGRSSSYTMGRMLGQVYGNKFMLIGLLFSVLSTLLLSLITNAYVCEYASGQLPVQSSAVWQRVRNNWLQYLIYSFFATIFIFIGLFLCFLPGVYLAFLLPVGLIIITHDPEEDAFGAMRRANDLTGYKWFSTFGLVLVLSLAVVILSNLPAIPLAIMRITGVSTQWGIFGEALEIILSTITSFLSTFLYSIVLVALAFQYFNLLELRDSIGLLERIDTLGEKPAAKTDEDGEY